ncbi:unnamed protein product [Ilex paraguariensis]|uniref:30S ribosomal protein 3, chloroplastic n=1 Tax=Ilex paraguariensis TaxID=185542 RepID=A0ABC8U397_9AQUA
MSMAVQPGVSGSFTCPSFPHQKPCFRLFNPSIPLKQKAISPLSPTILELKSRHIKRIQTLSASAAIEAVEAETPTEDSTSAPPQDTDTSQETKKLEVVVKTVEKPRLVLKFIWMEKNIGLALDQRIPGHGTIPLSPYFFWPRKDAWEELKVTLESKPWISQKKMIILLNQATDIINLWQQSGGNLS